jgi:hypothetical protein
MRNGSVRATWRIDMNKSRLAHNFASHRIDFHSPFWYLNCCFCSVPLKLFPMKKILAIALVLTSIACTAQRYGMEFSMSYLNGNPTGGMGRVIDRANGVSMNVGVFRPDKPFTLGLQMDFGQYGRDKSRQVYTMDDGTTADMDIIVSNSVGTMEAYGRWSLLTKGALRPYLTARAGYAWYNTALNIYDPDDFDHCEPVESDKLYNDGALVAGMGAGVNFDLSKIFTRLDKGMLFLDVSYSLRHGGRVNYMKTHGPDPGHTHNHNDHVSADFINTETQVVHTHYVGYLYSDFIQMNELRVGLTVQLQR